MPRILQDHSTGGPADIRNREETEIREGSRYMEGKKIWSRALALLLTGALGIGLLPA